MAKESLHSRIIVLLLSSLLSFCVVAFLVVEFVRKPDSCSGSNSWCTLEIGGRIYRDYVHTKQQQMQQQQQQQQQHEGASNGSSYAHTPQQLQEGASRNCSSLGGLLSVDPASGRCVPDVCQGANISQLFDVVGKVPAKAFCHAANMTVYDSARTRACLRNKRVVLLGDSTMVRSRPCQET